MAEEPTSPNTSPGPGDQSGAPLAIPPGGGETTPLPPAEQRRHLRDSLNMLARAVVGAIEHPSRPALEQALRQIGTALEAASETVEVAELRSRAHAAFERLVAEADELPAMRPAQRVAERARAVTGQAAEEFERVAASPNVAEVRSRIAEFLHGLANAIEGAPRPRDGQTPAGEGAGTGA